MTASPHEPIRPLDVGPLRGWQIRIPGRGFCWVAEDHPIPMIEPFLTRTLGPATTAVVVARIAAGRGETRT